LIDKKTKICYTVFLVEENRGNGIGGVIMRKVVIAD
jgi:hypothetical protein